MLFVCSLPAQVQDSPFDLERITREDGLGHNQVECIFQDSDGFIWFGTRNGLGRYDGFEIINFRHTLAPGAISGNRILSINEDKEGFLWVGTFQSGINRLNRETAVFEQFDDQPGLGSRINNISVSGDSTVWLCTDNGLAKYRPQTNDFLIYLEDPGNAFSLNSNQVSDFMQTSSGEYYVATWDQAIQRFDPQTGRFTDIQYERDPGLMVEYRKRLAEDRQGRIWISANQHGLCRYDPQTGVSDLFTLENSGLNTNVLNGDMLVDQGGLIWISTDGNGINIMDPETNRFSYLSTSTGPLGTLPGDQVYAIYQDMQNHIWVGLFDKGVVHINALANNFERSLFQPSDLDLLLRKSVLTLFQDTRGRVWAGTDGDGLYCFPQSGTPVIYRHDPLDKQSISSDVITSIGQDPNGNILIGTYAAGFNILDPVTGKLQIIEQGEGPGSVHSSSIWEIYRDSRDNIWLGLLGNGLDLYDPEEKSFLNMGMASSERNRVNHPNIMVILEDADGDLWFGTEGNGVNILDRQTGTMTEPMLRGDSSILQSCMVRSLFQDRIGLMWIGTEGQGVFILNKKSGEVRQMSVDDGLPDNIIQGIAEDNRGIIWITTGNGLAMFNPVTGVILNYFESDGLAANEFNSDAIIELNDGRMLAGSINGIDVIEPTEMVFNQNIPRVVLTELEIMNDRVEVGDMVHGRVILDHLITYTDQITLSHDDKLFSIAFAALNFVHPEKCEFIYMLEGFEEDWVETSSDRRIATYSNLKPGDYVFKVKASNNDGKWGFNTRELKISVLPPFWRTWWFITIVVLVLGLAIFYVYMTRLQSYKNSFLQERAQQEKRIMQLEKENLESELKKLTFFRLNRNRNLLELKNRLTGLSLKARESVKTGLEGIIQEIDSEISSDKDWKHIEPQLDITYNNFISKLREKHPDMTLSEIKIAAYVRMNLSTKEIAEYMHKTIRAIENDRHRLRKKLGLEGSDSLREYLFSI
jgi:ligand-binding sensor domain-containing protein/DNA-binding CsgD family transcriptional regulator